MNFYKNITTSKTISKFSKLIEMTEKFPDDYYYQDYVYLGKSKIYKIPVMLNLDMLLNPHISIIGITGSGKTHLSKNLIIGHSIKKNYNILIIDWNGEYGEVVDFLCGKVYKMNEKLGINILELYKTSSKNRTASIISELLYLNESDKSIILKIFGMLKPHELNIKNILNGIDNFCNKSELHLRSRIEYLINSGLFSDNTIDIIDILKGVTSIDLSNLNTQEEKQLFARTILKFLLARMYDIKPKNKINYMLVLDEVWKVLSKDNDINKFFRESRKYGFSMVVSSQMSTDINNEIMANSACAFIFRLQSDSDLSILKNSGIISIEDPRILKRGSCILSLSEKNSQVKRFTIEVVDKFNVNSYKIKCDSMIISISRDKFSNAIKKLDIDSIKQQKIILFAEQNEKNIDLKSLILFLKELDVDRPSIISALSQMGLDELVVVNVYESVKEVVIND